MKGLLLKDLYMFWKYCRAYLLLVAAFLVFSTISSDNAFFLIYPSLMTSLVPMSVLAYDEQHKWHQYALTLPYNRKQLVSVKFLLGLMAGGFIVLATALSQSIRMAVEGSFQISELLTLVGTVFAACFLTPSLSLPFIFKLGAEKGRIYYSISIGVVCAVAAMLSVRTSLASGVQNPLSSTVSIMPNPLFSIALLCLAAAAVYGFAWWLSIRFYEKREF